MSRLGRTLFVVFAAFAVALVIGGTACTRRGGEGSPPVVTPTPITGYYVDPVKGNDSNNGSQTTPFKTITRALKAVKSTVASAQLTISLNPGRYSTKSGELFPIVIPTGVTIVGSNYGFAISKASFINGAGEDTALEKAEGKPSSHTAFATVVVPAGVSLAFNKIYIGTTVEPNGSFASVDVLGGMSASSATFGQGLKYAATGGVIVAGGTLTCTACVVLGKDFAIKAFSVQGSGSSSAGGAPRITLQGPGHSIIDGGDGIRTDGTATIDAASQVFQSRYNAYTDSLTVPTASPGFAGASPSPTSSGSSSSSSSSSSSGSVDFGYGAQGSLGGNVFVGSVTEINVTLGGVEVFARGNTWNVTARGPQKTNSSGQYPRPVIFRAGADGQNVKIAGNAAGSTVNVGPAKPPSPTPSPYASGSPSSSPSPTSSPT